MQSIFPEDMEGISAITFLGHFDGSFVGSFANIFEIEACLLC